MTVEKKSLIGKRETVRKALAATGKPRTTSTLKPKTSTQPATYAPFKVQGN